MDIFLSHRTKAILLACVGFLLYASTIQFDYAQDDSIVITDNMFTQKGLAGISEILKHDGFYGFFKVEGKEQLVQGGRYRPLSQISFAIEHSIFGGNARVSHAINALLYGLLGSIIYLMFCTLLAWRNHTKEIEWISFVTAVLFIVHPVHTEVVANIKGRDELLVTLLGCIAIYLFFKKSAKSWHYVLATISILLSYFSKENGVLFAFILPLTWWFFNNHKNDKGRREIWIIIGSLAVIIFLYVRSQVLGSYIASASNELMNNPFLKYEGNNLVPFSMNEKWSTVLFNLGKYLQLMLFPYPLTSDYYPYAIEIKSFTDWRVWISLLMYLGGGLFAILGLLRKQPWAWGIIWFLAFLFPVSNVLFNIGTNLNERFLFLPSLGFIFTLVYIIFHFLGKRSANRKLFMIAFIIVSLLASIYTIMRSQVWKNDFTLLTTDVHTSKNSAKALNGAGGAYSTAAATMDEGPLKVEYLQRSNEYLNKALTIHPLYSAPRLIMGNNYIYLKQYDKAIESYNQLLAIRPEHQDALRNLQIAYRDGGRYYGEVKGDLNRSISYLTEAYKLNSRDYETVRLMGVSQGVAGNHAQAVKYFEEAVNLEPKEPYAYFNLGNAYFLLGDEEKGKANHQKVLSLDPNFKELRK